MTELRLHAWENYESFTHGAEPELAGTPLRALHAFTEPPESGAPAHQWPKDLHHSLEERGDEEGLVFQRDSTILSRSISKEQSKRGIIFTDLDAAIKMMPDLVKPYFSTQVRPDNKWAALHTALWSGGSFLYVPENLHVDLPFHACVWMSTPGAAVFPHTLIVVEKGSRVSFLDECLSPTWEVPALSSGAVEIWIGENAQVNYFNVQNWGKSVFHFDHRESQLANSGSLLSLAVSTGGNRLKSALHAELMELGLSRTVNLSRTFSLAQADYPDATDFFDDIFQKLPPGALVEKLRHFVEGKYTGQRPSLTLEQVARLHPEVRI